ncbi:hypothetical protein FGB62_142g029 [Gracilaria domingensis]|nr:hypothetical protein FGB62_142g029 [Gracilaria domingensis]
MTPPATPRAPIVLLPLVAILISTRAAVLVQTHSHHNSPFTTAAHTQPHRSSDPTWQTTASAHSYTTPVLELPTRRLVSGEERSPPVKSVLRQTGDNAAGEALDDFFSSLQSPPSTPAPEGPRTATPGSTPEEATETQLEPSPFETGPVIVLDPENASNSEQSDDRDVQSPAALETDDDVSSSPEVGEADDDAALMGATGETVSAQEAEFKIDSSAGKANQAPLEQALEEDDPEPSPSITGTDPIFETLSSIMDSDNADESGAPTRAPSDASTNGSGGVSTLSMADTAPQNETSRVQVDISVRSTSVTTVSQDLDTYVRQYLASQTDTSPEEWKPVFVSAAEETEERGVTFFVWALNYQGVLSSADLNADVSRLQDTIFSGGLETFLRSTLATDSISVQLFNDVQRDVQDKPRVAIEDIGTISADGQPTSNENAATGGEPDVSESRADAEGGDSQPNNSGLIVGTSLGFVALVALGVAGYVVARRSSNSPRHTLDGEEIAPPTLTSFHSISTTDSTPSRFQTGAPVNPRGATMLRNQSRLLDWRAEQAAASDRESRVEILE